MTTLTYQQTFQTQLDLIEAELSALFKGPFEKSAPKDLWAAMQYAILGGGKRLRPILLIETCLACGGDTKQALPTAMAIELIHGYSLIHDDLPCMDNDDLRRGRPTTHKAFSEATALLAGDALNAWVYSLIIENTQNVSAERLLTVISKLSQAASLGKNGDDGLVSGQSLDMQAETGEAEGSREDMLRRIHHGKTAALIAFSIEAGALLAGAKESTVQKLKQFGQELGLMFQIKDDLLDVLSSSEKLGKTTGKDASQNKLTFPSVYGVEKSQTILRTTAETANDILDSLTAESNPSTIETKALQKLCHFVADRDH